jgi:non-canonical purine NTP pyrophosphatase (RdgB/HAM1 family)
MPLYVATGNPHKLEEFKAILGSSLLQKDLDLFEIQGDLEDIVISKASQAFAVIRKPVVVDDTGLFISSMGNLPGPYIKHFLVAMGHDGVWNLVKPMKDRSATARCIIGYCEAAGEVHLFEGAIPGNIVAPRGENNFGKKGWDAIFLPDGHKKTFGEMSFGEKTKIDHRTEALLLFKRFLKDRVR